MALNLTKHFNLKNTPQTEAIPGKKQVKNSAGGYAFAVDIWVRLDRFLVLGTEGGSYYSTERALTVENAKVVLECLKVDGSRTIERIVEISEAGRAPKNGPAIFALAMGLKLGDEATRRLAAEAVPRVCRIGTHLFNLARDVDALGGWGRITRRAFARWYIETPVDRLAYQAVKYQSRDGWSHRDVLRLSHPKVEGERDEVLRWIVKGEGFDQGIPDGPGRIIGAVEAAKRAKTKAEIVALIREHRLVREAIPTEWLNEADVWAALLEDMPLTALMRNLATMTRVGLLAPLSASVEEVTRRLGDGQALARARVHPIAVLIALMTYRAGRGLRGRHEWTPVAAVVDALDAAFYAAFANVAPTGKRWLMALDVSGSMTVGAVAGAVGLTPRVASAAMALVTMATEKNAMCVAFATGLKELDIGPRMRLDTVLEKVTNLPFGGTDCALPMVWAKERKVDVDVFAVYTDSETWAGRPHPSQALAAYRSARRRPAKSIVVGMVANRFSIADPEDGGMLDVVGFDTATPQVMSDFAVA